jgi:hypothetical protein
MLTATEKGGLREISPDSTVTNVNLRRWRQPPHSYPFGISSFSEKSVFDIAVLLDSKYDHSCCLKKNCTHKSENVAKISIQLSVALKYGSVNSFMQHTNLSLEVQPLELSATVLVCLNSLSTLFLVVSKSVGDA